MKKTKLLILLLLGLFLNTTNVHAETFQRTNVDNGKISISLNSNKGYAGAIDATIKLTGNVSLSKIEWNQSLNDLAMRDYEYDKKSNTIRIILVTKNTDQNLLDQSGNLKIGNLVVTSDKTESYNVELSNLSITNLDLVKTEIKSDSITSTGDKSFTITLQNTNPSSTTKPSATTKPSTTTNPSKSDDSENKDDKNQNNDNLDKDDTNNNKNDEDNNKDDGINNDNKNKNGEKNDKDTNKKDNEKMTVALIIGGALLALVILISVIIYIVKRNRNLDDIVESQIIEKD